MKEMLKKICSRRKKMTLVRERGRNEKREWIYVGE